jgi:uncharacterized protein (TIGR00730 family)
MKSAKFVCVFCSSSELIDEEYKTAAKKFGSAIAQAGWSLVYGGGNIGLMGVLAKAVHESGGKVIGVIPRAMLAIGLAYRQANELIVTETLRERKAAMEERSNVFVALPGGIGTLEELLEIITLKQLGYHKKPIIILNTNGFFDPLLAQLERCIAQRFAGPELRNLYFVAPSVEDALSYINSIEPSDIDLTRQKPAKEPKQPEAMEAID